MVYYAMDTVKADFSHAHRLKAKLFIFNPGVLVEHSETRWRVERRLQSRNDVSRVWERLSNSLRCRPSRNRSCTVSSCCARESRRVRESRLACPYRRQTFHNRSFCSPRILCPSLAAPQMLNLWFRRGIRREANDGSCGYQLPCE
jgi:hypothetical protein